VPIIDAHLALAADALESGLSSVAAFEIGARALGVRGVVAIPEAAAPEDSIRCAEAAARLGFVRAVVGQAPPEAAGRDLGAFVARLGDGGKLRGVRIEAGAASGADLAFLRGAGLVCHLGRVDLPAAAALVERHPDVRFVLEALGWPPVAANELEPWRTHLRALARRPNVWCGVAGFASVAAGPRAAHEARLWPFFDVAVEAFRPARLMFGSAWPHVSDLAGYARWLETVEMWIDVLTEAEQAQIMGGAATELYRLNVG
jgi:L-fuconolactonase